MCGKHALHIAQQAGKPVEAFKRVYPLEQFIDGWPLEGITGLEGCYGIAHNLSVPDPCVLSGSLRMAGGQYHHARLVLHALWQALDEGRLI